MPVILARLLMLMLAAGAAWAVIRVLRDLGQGARPGIHKRNGHSTYRPRNGNSDTQERGDHTEASQSDIFVMTRQQVHGLRDALTSAPIDPGKALVCCAQCRCMYHASSAAALREGRGGACVNCGSHDLSPVHLAD